MLPGNDRAASAAHTAAGSERTRSRIAQYLREVGEPICAPEVAARCDCAEPGAAARALFGILVDREFCYLSKSRVAPYRPAAVAHFEAAIARGEPVDLYYDLGGGYHASLRPGREGVSFRVGLGEWLVLRQIARFRRRAALAHAPGVRFHIVIDNLLALAVNDIPLESTAGYVARMRALIAAAGLSECVHVLPESELSDAATYVDAVGLDGPAACAEPLGPRALETVQRFVGYPCTPEEAHVRQARYARAARVSDRVLGPHVRGLRMTQRATPETLCFRPFPGADCRIQSGQVCLRDDARGRLRPFLLTSGNACEFALSDYQFPEILPALVGGVTYAVPRELSE